MWRSEFPWTFRDDFKLTLRWCATMLCCNKQLYMILFPGLNFFSGPKCRRLISVYVFFSSKTQFFSSKLSFFLRVCFFDLFLMNLSMLRFSVIWTLLSLKCCSFLSNNLSGCWGCTGYFKFDCIWTYIIKIMISFRLNQSCMRY